MEQLNKKRTDLRNQQKVLNDKIGKSEEKKLFLENKKGVLESRRDELNCKSQSFAIKSSGVTIDVLILISLFFFQQKFVNCL